MTETSYTAWDDKLYQWPPPEGWYQAGDGKWWPTGYGPGPAAPAADPVSTATEAVESGFDAAGGQASSGLGQAAAQVGTEAAEPVTGALDDAGSAVSDVTESAGDAVAGARDAFGGAVDDAAGAVGGAGGALGDALGDVADDAAGAVGGAGGALGDVLGGAADGAGDAFSGVADHGGQALGGITDRGGEALGGATDDAGAAFGGITDRGGEALGGATDQAAGALGSVADGAGGSLGGVADRAGEAFSDVADSAGGALGGVAESAGGSLGGVADGVGESVGGAVGGLTDALPGSLGGVADEASAGLGDAVDAAAGALGAPQTESPSDIGFSERFGETASGAADAASELAETLGTPSDGLDASARELAAQHDLSFDPAAGSAAGLDPTDVGVDESLWASPPGQTSAADAPAGLDGFASDPDLAPPDYDAVAPTDLPPPLAADLSTDPLAASFDPDAVSPLADAIEAPAPGSFDPTAPLPGDGLPTAGFEEVAPPLDEVTSPLAADPSAADTIRGPVGDFAEAAAGFQAPVDEFGAPPDQAGDVNPPAVGLDAPTASFEAQAPEFDAQAAGMQAPVAGFDTATPGLGAAPAPDGLSQQPFGQPGGPTSFQQPPPGSDPTAAWNQPSAGGAPAGPPLQGGPVETLPSRSSRSRWLLIVLGVVALLAICAAIYYLLTRGDDSTPEATGPGSLAEPHDRSNGVLVFYPSGDDRQEWVITVLEPVSDASAEVEASPADGDVFATTRIRVLNQAGSGSASLDGLRFNAVTSSGEVIDGQDNRCSVGGDLDYAAQLAESEQIEGAVCWEIPADDLGGLLLGIESTEIAGRVHVTLDP